MSHCDTLFCTLLHCLLASLADLPHEFLRPGRAALGKGDAPDIVGSDLQPAVKGEEGGGGGEEGPVARPAADQPVTVAAALCLDSRIVLHLLPHLHPASRVCVSYLCLSSFTPPPSCKTCKMAQLSALYIFPLKLNLIVTPILLMISCCETLALMGTWELLAWLTHPAASSPTFHLETKTEKKEN